ncbi:PWWP domain-containing protein 3-like [Salvia miltiorrhiza]|uniref:PWWP domain-containing protein 3-like n=1 Tax=Salvia miltiorrhiza TaxID=226208 RepID=UPI0025AB9CF4|nr:PWWP domain-containing protein 3-like [Salvia miltiorrhiza]XP_057769329.1 PWWP domain-containing protein 3-like [Salvia miltiorrhiza]XP_057769330.1 PWWP domain-containing protein 3-like [Salvia miltiorrhiza]
MSRLKDTVAAEELPTEGSGNLMGGSVSKLEAIRVGSLEAKKDDGGSVTAASAAIVDIEKDLSFLKIGFWNLSDEEFEGTRSVSDSVVDGRGVLDVDGSSTVVARDEKIIDADFTCTDNTGSGDGMRGRERGTINLNADVSVDGNGVGRWNGERVEDQDHGFRVGDLVWGKIKSHPWWPGQVYDPRDASEFALKHSQEGRVLVAFFGDGSCSWCLPSQLVPFVENFDRMWSDRPLSSRSFVNAVQRAVDEIGRLLESRMTCGCIPLEKRDHLARPMVANAGIKAGVLMPEVAIDRLPIPEYEPAEIRAKVVGFAKTASFDNLFELVILRSWISACSYAKCGSRLPVYGEPLVIEGLEYDDDEKNGFSVPTPLPAEGPLDDKIYQNTKQKSVAELMAKKKIGKSKKTKKMGDGVVVNGHGRRGRSSAKRDRKTRDEVSGLSDTTDRVTRQSKPKLECEIGFSSRERKKSKYLSPPYTSLGGRIVDSGYKLEPDLDELSEVDTIEKNTTDGDSRDEEISAFAFPELDDEENEQKMAFSASDVDLEVNELLLKLESAAIDRFFLTNEGHLDPVWAFVSAYRSSTYLHGSDLKPHHKCKKVSHKRKRPSLASPSAPRPRGCSPKVSLPCKRPADEPADDLVSDARAMRQKLDSMTTILEDHGLRFSSDDKTCLKEELKVLMEKVVTAGEKVRLMAEKTSS